MEKQFISRKIEYSDLGLIDYQKAWDLQHQLFTKRLNNEISDTLLLLEHPHTYTLGKSSNKENLLLSEVELKEQNISLYDIDRGGDITYHGPGQIVGYPIINLSLWKEDTHEYLRALEEVIIQTLAEYGIEGVRNEVHTGVWVNDKKICAIGIKVRSWITMHGFAFNVNTDMKLFNGIIPCGIENKSVTSLSEIKGETIELDGVKEIIFEKFKKILDYN